MSVSVSVVSDKTITLNKALADVKGGKAVRIKAIKGGKYLLSEGEQGVAPENITVKRVGKNLHVALEGTNPDQAELVIEDFFGNEGELIGLGEDGEYHEYIAVDGDIDNGAAFLTEGVSSPLALGYPALEGFGHGLVFAGGMLPWALAGLGAIVGGAIVEHNRDDGKKVEATKPDNKGIGSVIDDKGPQKGLIGKGGVTDDDRPTLGGSGQTPGDKVTVIDNGKVIGEVVVDKDGNWSFTPESSLPDGEHSFEVVITDPKGNVSGPSDEFVVIIDTKPPAKPSIENVIDDQGLITGPVGKGGHTDDTKPTLSGKGDPGDTVTIIDNGKVIGETQIGKDGSWTFTPKDPLGDGEHKLQVIVSDPAGNSSAPSDEYVVVIDTIAPTKPAIESVFDDQGSQTGYLSSGDATDDAKPTLSGSAEAGSTVVIKDNGKEIGRVTAGGDGKWTFEPTLPLDPGRHGLTVEAIDAAGNTSVPSDVFELTIGNPSMPVAPAITSVVDDVGSVTGNIQKNAVTDDTRPTINGTAQAGMTVSVYIDGKLAGTTTVQANGAWSFTPMADLADGLHNITATATNSLGNISPETGEYPIRVDTTPPPKPNPGDASLWDDEGSVTGPIISGDVTDDSTPTFTGKTEPNATVVIYDAGVEIGRVTAGNDGVWSFTPSPGLDDDDHALSYEVIDVAGNVSPRSDEIVFTVDTSKLVVSIEGAIDDVGSVVGAIAKNGVTDDATPTLHGKATAGGTVKVYEGTKLLGETVAGSDGKWSFTPSTALSEGTHSLTATVTTVANGESDRSSAFDFRIDLTAPEKPSIGQVFDDVGVLQGALSNGQSTDDTTPTLSGKAEVGSTVHVYDNGSLLGDAVADVHGNWSFTPNPPLASGNHEFTVTAEDKAGNVSSPSDGFAIVIDTIPPIKPVIEAVYDDQGDQKGNLASGDATDDAKPTLSGRAEPNSTIVIKDNGVEIGRAPVGADGKWTLEPKEPLLLGEHKLTAEAIDAAGNTSVPSDGFYLTLGNPDQPVAPSITSVVDDVGLVTGNIQKNAVTDDTRPTVNGSAQPGMTVSVYIDGALAGTTVAKANGEWSFTPSADLPDGLHNITATATNSLGNVSPTTGEYPIVVDTVPPSKPNADDAKLWDDAGTITGAIKSGDTTDDSTPTFIGKTEANATVVIYDDGKEIGRVQADAAGDWEFTPGKPLIDGDHKLSYQVIDVAGNIGPKSDEIVFKVDTSTLVVSIDGATDDAGKITGAITKNGVTDDTTPTLHGRATAGGTVKVYEGSMLLGEAVAGSDGKWSFTPSTALSEGMHSLTATVTTVASGESDRSSAFDFRIDLTAPEKPSIGQVFDDVGVLQGALSNGQSTDDTTPTLSGKAEAGSTVHILDKGGLLGSVVADAGGNWSFTPNPPLLSGEHEFTVTAEDKAGNVSAPSDKFVIVIDTTPPAKPVIETVYDDQGNQKGNLASGDATDDAKPTLSGSAEPNSTIVIKDNGVEIGRAPVDADGRWTFEPKEPLVLGEHKLTAEAVDAAGNTSAPSDRFDLTLGNPDQPVAPSITSVVDDVGLVTGNIQKNTVTDDPRPTVNGSAQPGMTVSVYIDGNLAGTTVAKANGEWSFTPSADLPDGLHNITATATNSLGNISPETGNYPIIVDTVPPPQPNPDDAILLDDAGTITGAIKSGDTTDDSTPTFIGKTEANATVVIYDDGKEIGRVQADAAGNWEFTPTKPLIDGDHKLNYQVIDVAGNVGPKSDEIVFKVDTSKLEVTIDGATDDAGKITGVIAKNGVTDDTTPTLYGKATAGGTVKVYEGSTLLGATVAGSDGKWSFTPSTALSEGTHSLTATVTTVANGESTASAPFDFRIDLTAPDKPSIDKIMDDVGDLQGALNPGQSTDDTTPTLSGKAEAGSTVHILDKGGLLGSVVADAGGNWSFTPNPPLLSGEHEFTVTAEDKAGNVSAPSDKFAIVIDTTPPAKPVIEAVLDDVGAKTGNLAQGEMTDDTMPTISGTAEAGSTVIIKDKGTKIGSVVAGSDGKWTFEPGVALAAGGHEFTAEAVDAAGNVSQPSDSFAIIVDSVLPTAPKISNLTDDVGIHQGLVMNGSVTDDARPELGGTGKAGETIEIRNDGVALGRTVVNENGRWSFTPETALKDGHYIFTAVAISAGGAESVSSNVFAVEIDTKGPDRPLVENVEDDAGAWQGSLTNGQVTDDRTPTFSGKAEAGSVIMVFANGEEVGDAPVDDDGNWTYQSKVLPFGEHSFTFYAIDPAGNWSVESAPWTVIVAINGRSLDKAGETDGVLSVEGLLIDAHVEAIGQPRDSVKPLAEPVHELGIESGNAGEWQDSWVVGSARVVTGVDWTVANQVETAHPFEQQLMG